MATERQLIDKKYAWKTAQRIYSDPVLLHTIKNTLDTTPTVDAVEVVRCKDCKHFVEGEPYDPCECMKWNTKYGVTYTTPDGYCHKGERRTDERKAD